MGINLYYNGPRAFITLYGDIQLVIMSLNLFVCFRSVAFSGKLFAFSPGNHSFLGTQVFIRPWTNKSQTFTETLRRTTDPPKTVLYFL